MRIPYIFFVLSLLFYSCKTQNQPDPTTELKAERCDPVADYVDSPPTNLEMIKVMNQIGWPKKDNVSFGVKDTFNVDEKKHEKLTDFHHLLIHDYLINNINCNTRTPEWVINKLQKKYIARQYCRESEFQDDYLKKEYKIENCEHLSSDYSNSGFQRGHLAPAMDFAGYSQKAISDSNLTSNIAPQIGVGFNENIWKELEETVRIWASQDRHLLIVTGVIHVPDENKDHVIFFRGPGPATNSKNKWSIKHENPQDVKFVDITNQGIGKDNKIQIPDYYYKFVIHLDDNNQVKEVLPFLMKNIDHSVVDYPNNKIICLDENGNETTNKCPKNDNGINFARHLTSIDKIEELSGYDFFSNLNLDESTIPKMWRYPNDDRYKQVD